MPMQDSVVRVDNVWNIDAPDQLFKMMEQGAQVLRQTARRLPTGKDVTLLFQSFPSGRGVIYSTTVDKEMIEWIERAIIEGWSLDFFAESVRMLRRIDIREGNHEQT